jgi:hypothetical protein
VQRSDGGIDGGGENGRARRAFGWQEKTGRSRLVDKNGESKECSRLHGT